MSNKKQAIIQTEGMEAKNSVTLIILVICTIVFLFVAPYGKALFNGYTIDFERPLDTSLIWSSIFLLVLSIFLFYKQKTNEVHSFFSVYIWAIPLTYCLALFHAKSQYLSHFAILLNLIYAIFFLLGMYLAKNIRSVNFIIAGILGSGYAIILLGISHWLGDSGYMKWFVAPGKQSIYPDAVMLADGQFRLTSVFQYANSYAAYLIAIMLSCAFLAAKSKKWAMTSIATIILVPAMVSFLLTLSRGAIVVIPFVLIIILFFLPMYKQIMLLIHLAIAGIATLLVLDKVTAVGQAVHAGTSTQSGSGWLALIAASILAAGLSTLLQLYAAPWLQARLGAKMKSFMLPVVCIVVGAIGMVLLFSDTGVSKLLPANIKDRIENINFAQHSVLERGTFYVDAMKVFKDYPLIGAGGGAWADLYEKYQSYPYTSRQAHNFFLQYLIEVGAIGLLVLLLFLGYIGYYYIRHYIRSKSEDERERHFVFFIVTISLLLHSMIDFDMSYVYLAALVFLCLGGLVAPIQSDGPGPKWVAQLRNKHEWTRWIYPGCMLVLSLVMFVISVRLLAGNTAFKQAEQLVQEQKPLDQVMERLDQALSMATNHPDYTLYKVGLLQSAYTQTKDEKYFNQASAITDSLIQAEPHNRYALNNKYNFLVQKGKLTDALKLINENVPNFVWDINMYDKQIALDFELGNQARMQKNYTAMDSYWGQCLEIYNTVLEKMKQLSTLPKEISQGRPFYVTPNISFAIGQIDYIHENYASASDILKQGITDQWNDPVNRNIASWYLAALQKQGKSDQAMYDKLVAADPNQKGQIQTLVNAVFLTK
jgi:hypothetical protein